MGSTEPTVGPFLSAARKATGNSHDTLEETLRLDTITRTRDDYLHILRRFWGVWDPIERLLTHSPIAGDQELNLNNRLRAHLLLKDLEAISEEQIDISGLKQPALPWPNVSMPQAAGILYMLEGSRLGGKLISRNLEANLGITESTGGSFFASAGTDPIHLWRTFVRWAENTVPGEQIDEATQTAREAFDLLNNWFEPVPAI